MRLCKKCNNDITNKRSDALFCSRKCKKDTWENHSVTGWHIDHIKSLASFNLSNREELLKACHYSNLQPLWAKDNIKKGASLGSLKYCQ